MLSQPESNSISWNDLLFGKFTRRPTREMLQPDGVHVLYQCRIIGESKTGLKILRNVNYDRDYVKAFLRFWKIHELPHNEIQKILKEIRDEKTKT